MSRWNPTDIVLRYEALESERRNLDGTYSLIEQYVMPGRGRFFQNDQVGEEGIDWSDREIFDGTQYNALQTLVANVHGNLTSDAFKWFELQFEQDELNDDPESIRWLEDCSNRQHKALQESNFSLETMEFYTDAAGFGTAVMLHDEDEGEVLGWNGHRFGAQMMRQCYFEEGFDGRPIALYISRSYSPRQLEVKFGRDALPEYIAQKLDNPDQSQDRSVDVIRVIYLDIDNKNNDVSGLLEMSKRPYVGRYVIKDHREFLGEEQGFYEFPGYILRWARTAGSKYGYCPTIVALGDILTLQEMVMMIRTATEKTVDPPMKSTRRGVLSELDQQGGGLTFVRAMDDLAPLVPPGAYRVDSGWADINDLRRRIDRMFYVDQLELKESPQMTATEVRVRYELMQRLLGPTLGRIKTDFLDPLIRRSFWMMYRKGAFEAMPQKVREMQGTFKVTYLGPLAKAQRMNEVDAIQRWLYMGAEMSRQPGLEEIMDVPDFAKAYKHIGDVLGVPAYLIRTDAEIKRDKENRKKQQAVAQQGATTEQAANVAATIARAKKDMGNAA